jgi:3-hydroxybutyryl-CoA dehydrogenase
MSARPADSEPFAVAITGDGPVSDAIADAARAAGCDVALLRVDDPGSGLGDHVDLVVEAGSADPHAAVAALDAVLGEDVVIATTTATVPVTGIAAQSRAPGRVGGLHFVDLGRTSTVVEVVAAEQTAPATLEVLGAFVEHIGRTPVCVKDRPGFLVQRLLLPYLNQALQAFDDGIASREDIDAAVELGLGYPVGPLRLLEQIGLDRHLELTGAVFDQLHDTDFAPPQILVRRVSAGCADVGGAHTRQDEEGRG